MSKKGKVTVTDRRISHAKLSDAPAAPPTPGGRPRGAHFATPPGSTPPGPGPGGNQGDAIAAFTGEVTTQLAAIGENVAEFSGQLQAVQENIVMLQRDQRSAATREQELIDGAQFAEVREQLEHMDQRGARLEALVGEGALSRNEHPGLSSFSREIAENEELQAWQTNGKKDNDPIRLEFKSQIPFQKRPAFGASTVVIDDSLVSAGSEPAQPPGLVQLLREDIGLVDVVNMVPPETTDTYKRLVESDETLKGAVAAKSTDVVAGGTTAVDNIVLDNVEGYWATKEVWFYVTAGIKGPFTIATVDLTNKKLTFATALIDFDVAVGDLVCSKDYLLTGESEFAPAGVGKVEEKSVDMQAMPSYIPFTWQRLKRTNLFQLMPWLESLLREHKRNNLEQHLLYGSGVTAEKQLHGFLHASWLVNTDVWATLMAVGDNVIDLILRSASLIPGNRPKVCVMRDEDWQAAIYAKDSALNYIHGEGEGPKIINTPALKAVGGVRVVTSSKIALKTAQIFAPAVASDFVPGGDAELIVGTINAQLITGEAVVVSRESFGHLIVNATQAVRKLEFTTAPS